MQIHHERLSHHTESTIIACLIHSLLVLTTPRTPRRLFESYCTKIGNTNFMMDVGDLHEHIWWCRWACAPKLSKDFSDTMIAQHLLHFGGVSE